MPAGTEVTDEATPSDDNGGTASTPARRPRGTGTTPKVTYHVYAGSDVIHIVAEWVAGLVEDGADGVVLDGKETTVGELVNLARTLPSCIDGDDLIYLATKVAADRDGAVGQMLADDRPVDRVKLVQLAHKAQLDLDFPTVPGSYKNDVPVHWEVKPTFSIGGKR